MGTYGAIELSLVAQVSELVCVVPAESFLIAVILVEGQKKLISGFSRSCSPV